MFLDTNVSSNLGQTIRSSDRQQQQLQQQQKRTCWIVVFAIPANHGIKLKESEKRDKYLDLAREVKKQWNMKVTVIPIIIGALGTIIKELVQGLEDMEKRGRVEIIQTTALLRSRRNTEKSPGNLRRLAVTQTPEKNQQLTLMWKTLKDFYDVNKWIHTFEECKKKKRPKS